jgi:hypothetical protein
VFIAIQALLTTHDKEKKKMLSAALASSCKTTFASEDRKELFVRILRDLSPSHIQVLKKLFRPWYAPGRYLPIGEPEGEELAILQYLAANGLAEQYSTEDPHVSIPWDISDLSVGEGRRCDQKGP